MAEDKCICHRCKKEYSRKQLIRSLGEWSAPVMLGYCSAQCYTKTTVDDALEEINDK